MTLAGALHAHFTSVEYAEFFVRMLVACVCGACIGFERTKRFKVAGIRTHIIVCLGAALIMVVSKYGFADLTYADGTAFPGTRGADAARIAAQVVSGVSFLGAGVIFRNGGSIKGLTTAAGLWTTAAIGLAIGSGMYILGILATALVALLQIVMHRFRVGADQFNLYQMKIILSDTDSFEKVFEQHLSRWKSQVTDTKMNRLSEHEIEYSLILRSPSHINVSDFQEMLKANPQIRTISSLDPGA